MFSFKRKNKYIYQGKFEQNTAYDEIGIKQTYSSKQYSILIYSFLIAALGFLLTSGFGYLFQYIFIEFNLGDDPNFIEILAPISGISLLAGSFASIFFFFFRLIKKNKFFLCILLMLFFCLANGLAFGSLFSIFSIQEIMIIFLIVGLIFVFIFLLALILGKKIIRNLTKITTIAILGYSIIGLVTFLLTYFDVISTQNSTTKWIYLIASLVSGLISVFFFFFINYHEENYYISKFYGWRHR